MPRGNWWPSYQTVSGDCDAHERNHFRTELLQPGYIATYLQTNLLYFNFEWNALYQLCFVLKQYIIHISLTFLFHIVQIRHTKFDL